MSTDPLETEQFDNPKVSRKAKMDSDEMPAKIGRFVVQSMLGRGGFGVVYLASDEQLKRKVAIKVPHERLLEDADDTQSYLKEARTVAALEHPHIVPVLEVGSTAEFPIFVVSKYVEGRDLSAQLRTATPTIGQAVQWIIDLAEALRAAHKQGIVHRDVKPQNVLIDLTGKVYLVDFGLALRDEEVGKRLPAGSTPAYMSPEQAKGEGHRVDGRSDIFSLGVVFYELLVGRRPFHGDTHLELFEQITDLDPKPLRQWNDNVDLELERICLKMLAKRKSDRYSSAKQLIDDLQAYMASSNADDTSASHLHVPAKKNIPVSDDTDNNEQSETPVAATPTSGSKPLRIVPKGLRSFDRHDADFFLELLPGPRDRNGLPDTIGFWKTRIEERDADQTFTVGLIYGPSGCGKSSMMKAGLLPHLSTDIIAIYLEATSDQTEATLLSMLRKRLEAEQAHFDKSSSLVELLGLVRRGKVRLSNKKVLLVIDQFEQWLNVHTQSSGTELLDALLQCDGSRLQTIVMVRDDFWMAATRFFRDLDIPLLERQNSAAVDLFDVDHAERVLKAFGRAFGKLDDNAVEEKLDRKQFITESVRGLAEDGKVISVRLSLFAEMMKGRPWTLESLKAVGGTSGVGATFLEETFSASGAPPEHRYHQEAARAVLRSLLPDGGTEIKGHRRSRDELLVASSYHERVKDFSDLIRILDSELRLITPVDRSLDEASTASYAEPSASSNASSNHYQLTHDYLVPLLRDWLTRKQRETRKGRAELRLTERTATWSQKRENKQLATLSEWISIRTLTESKKWTSIERTMMHQAARVHGTLWAVMLLAVLLIGFGLERWIAVERWQNLRAQTQTSVEALQNNLGPSVPFNLEKLDTLPRDLVLPELQTRFGSASNPRHKLSLAFGLAHFAHADPEYLISRIDEVAESDTGNYLAALAPNSSGALEAIQAASAKCVEKSRWRRKAKLAITALNLGDTSMALDVCTFENRPDPEQRTLFIDEFRRWENNLKAIHDAVASSDSPALRSGICLAVGQISVGKIVDADRESWKDLASKWFVGKSDTSTHSASGWLLRQWNMPIPEIPKPNEIFSGRDWFVNSSGATMLKIRSREVDHSQLPDPLEIFRQDLASISQLSAEELDKPEVRKRRAIAYYQTGKVESALADLDWLMEHREDQSMEEILRYRTLALAGLGKAEEARESLAKYLQQEFYGTYMEIQVLAWLGDFDEAAKRLEPAASDRPKSRNDLYNIACASSLCAKAAVNKSPERAKQFVDRALEILRDLVGAGYKIQQIREDPDFANLHEDGRFASILLDRERIGEFWVADGEVTRGQFELFMNDTSYPDEEKPKDWEGVDETASPTANHPAQRVSWYDAVMYCNWLSKREGRIPCYELIKVDAIDGGEKKNDEWRIIWAANGYCMLSEVEWVYACCAGTQTEFNSGDDEILLKDYGQMYPSKTAAMSGQKLPNAWGLHDCHGNVCEWFGDLDDSSGSIRVLSGGSWHDLAADCGSAETVYAGGSNRISEWGFRVALSPFGVPSPAEQGQGNIAKPVGGGTE